MCPLLKQPTCMQMRAGGSKSGKRGSLSRRMRMPQMDVLLPDEGAFWTSVRLLLSVAQ